MGTCEGVLNLRLSYLLVLLNVKNSDCVCVACLRAVQVDGRLFCLGSMSLKWSCLQGYGLDP
jgi:hypothetical protein